MGGGVKNTEMFANSNFQIIHNKDHLIAKLIIQHYRKDNLRVDREQTLFPSIGYLHVMKLLVL